MPWVKDFDEEDVVKRAMKVFWAKGYESTSISDLLRVMEINKGSFYNAFGSKKALFVRALLKYDRENRQRSIATLEALGDPVASIKTLFDGLVKESLADTEQKGCLLVNTALDLPNHSEDIKEMVTSALKDFEKFFERLIRVGQERGEIPDTIDVSQTAKSLLTQVVGLRVLARGVFDEASLRAIGIQALDQIT